MSAHPDELLLLPTPRRVERRAGALPVPGWAGAGAALTTLGAIEALTRPPWSTLVHARITGGWCGMSPQQQQSYRLEISPRAGDAPPVRIESPTPLGLRHGAATLAQLLCRFPRELPLLSIVDEPTFATRGVMLDVSRDRIPTMEEFGRIVPWLASLKVNHLQLYTEHTFAYAGHEEVWRGWSPITPEEARGLDTLCLRHGIELAANQNCFGHLRKWLELPRYAHLAETHGDWVFDVWSRTGPFSLCPTDPRSEAFVAGLLDQLLPCFRARLVNIGCDETYDIAFGRSKDEVARRGRADVYMEFVSKVGELVRRAGKRAMFWADIALSHPEVVGRIAPDMIALAWGYEPDSPFERWCEMLARAGRECWVCPGTSSWRSIAGRTSERRANVAAAARAGANHGAQGVLVCDWGDTGHWQQWPVSALGIAQGASAAWNVESAGEFDARAAALHALGDATLASGPWLEGLGDADLALRETCLGLARPGHSGRLRNQSALFIDLFKPRAESADVGEARSWEGVLGRVEGDLARSVPTTGEALLDAELRHTLAMMEIAARRGAWRRRPGGTTAEQDALLRRAWADLEGEHARLWRIRSREGGLADSLGFFGQVRKGL